MKSFLIIISVSLVSLSLNSQVSVRQLIEGTGVGIELGISINNVGHHGIQVVEAGATAGYFTSSFSSTDPAIVAQQPNSSGLYSDLELKGSQVIGSSGSIFLNVDNDVNNNTEDPEFFAVIRGNKSNPVFLVDQEGNTTADGNINAKRITASNLNDTQADLQLGGSTALVKASSFKSDLKLESNGNITFQIGLSDGTTNGQPTNSLFRVLDPGLEPAFSVDDQGVTRVGNVLVTSDRNKKENISVISSETILKNLIEMPIYKWNYKKIDRQHIGPMAQDFLAAFNLGNDGTTISTIDSDGISLAAIKGLYKLMQEELEMKSAEIRKLQDRITSLETKH